jgi:hypothetical protein
MSCARVVAALRRQPGHLDLEAALLQQIAVALPDRHSLHSFSPIFEWWKTRRRTPQAAPPKAEAAKADDP